MSQTDEKTIQQKDFLESFLHGSTLDNPTSTSESMYTKNEDVVNNQPISGYIDIDMSKLPLKYFYPSGTKIKIKKAEIEDVQTFTSMLDDNYIDVSEKMNSMLSSCVRYIHSNGSIGSYKNLKSGDRMYLLLKIRELTFQGDDQFFSKEVTCSSCDRDHDVYFRTFSRSESENETVINYTMPDKYLNYYNTESKTFDLNIDGVLVRLAPPTIGLEEIFLDHTKSLIQEKKNPNVSFLKLIPFILWDRDTITDEGIAKHEKEFKAMNMKTYQVINKFVNSLKFGTKGIKCICPHCNVEFDTDLTFKGGTSNLFLVTYDEFEDLF